CDEVGTARHALDALCGRAKDQIPGLMPQRVVDELEIIQVEKQQRERLGFRAGLRDDRLHDLVQTVPVREACQRIEVRQLPQLVARALQAALPQEYLSLAVMLKSCGKITLPYK